MCEDHVGAVEVLVDHEAGEGSPRNQALHSVERVRDLLIVIEHGLLSLVKIDLKLFLEMLGEVLDRVQLVAF